MVTFDMNEGMVGAVATKKSVGKKKSVKFTADEAIDSPEEGKEDTPAAGKDETGGS